MVKGSTSYEQYKSMHDEARRPKDQMTSKAVWDRMSQMSQDVCIKILHADIEGHNKRQILAGIDTPQSEITPW